MFLFKKTDKGQDGILQCIQIYKFVRTSFQILGKYLQGGKINNRYISYKTMIMIFNLFNGDSSSERTNFIPFYIMFQFCN